VTPRAETAGLPNAAASHEGALLSYVLRDALTSLWTASQRMHTYLQTGRAAGAEWR